MGRILCIDYGTKRCGIAATDVLQIAVHAVGTVPSGELWLFLEEYLSKEEVEKIVIGYPTHSDGSEFSFMHQIVGLERKIKKIFPQIELDRHDEAFSSARAKEVIIHSGIRKEKRKDKGLVDKISAVLILQDYLKHI
ncbi:MAG TPA: Holliday junction resolvase RuvX [Saprospiraceae bacterium]|nr:MAG: Holliday junction resolvase [Candidatus Parvibacillus calidus]MBX2937020.1 Holliday junction resolvase RuvX [Saprospiraceae bacterium]MBK7739674.1 Holliday junction resolvase RuvX [Candidatus Parvibacillus calidus]MBX7180433.1 Holliday junction resolvase RuvX [Saprospiraceae bacterium]MCB0591628.1 Holliday junction resolvase RuvX [Saprospiraceae bacterium]